MEHISYKQGRRLKGFVPYVSSVFLLWLTHILRERQLQENLVCVSEPRRGETSSSHITTHVAVHPHFERTAAVYSLMFFSHARPLGNHLENMIRYASTNLEGHAWYLFEAVVLCSSPKAFAFLLTTLPNKNLNCSAIGASVGMLCA